MARVATSQLAIPNSGVFIGLPLTHQMLPAEFDAQNNLVEITATNALSLVVGTF